MTPGVAEPGKFFSGIKYFINGCTHLIAPGYLCAQEGMPHKTKVASGKTVSAKQILPF